MLWNKYNITMAQIGQNRISKKHPKWAFLAQLNENTDVFTYNDVINKSPAYAELVGDHETEQLITEGVHFFDYKRFEHLSADERKNWFEHRKVKYDVTDFPVSTHDAISEVTLIAMRRYSLEKILEKNLDSREQIKKMKMVEHYFSAFINFAKNKKLT